uniref:N-acetylaspartate synthetase n=1 Tax=Denticeps clupeoides TaxID=299321 RepID=A0AAY4BQI2_9TELE
MQSSPPDMVCETKIVADERDAIPAPKADAMMWSPAAAAPDAKGARSGDALLIREYERADRAEVRRIFCEGITERIPNTAFRGLRRHTRTQLLYALLTRVLRCHQVVALTCCAPFVLLGARYYYSRVVILAYLDSALHTDMADIEAYYLKPAGSGFWVAVLGGRVVGMVAAQGREGRQHRGAAAHVGGLALPAVKASPKRSAAACWEFALLNNYSAVVLGTTAVKMAAHKLYESLGFRRTGESEDYRPARHEPLAPRRGSSSRSATTATRLQLREE